MNNFKSCPNGHFYSADLDSCPFCKSNSTLLRCHNCGWENPIGRQRCEKCNTPLLKSQLEGIANESPSMPPPNNAMCYCSFPKDYSPIPENKTPKNVIRFGRASDNDVVINDCKVSSHHMEIRKRFDGRFTLLDLCSCHGTFVNGQDVGIDKVELHHGDIVQIGDVTVSWEDYFLNEQNP